MREPASIFNDVIGPVMIGPSSSHTAASVRIGRLIRQMLDDRPEKVRFEFSRQGSLAFCHEGQGTDMGLAGGLLGMAPEDPAMERSLELAAGSGLSVEFVLTDDPADHPNTYVFYGEGGGRQVCGEALSTGGGMIVLQKINGFPVSVCGGYHETLLFFDGGMAKRAELCAREMRDSGAYYQVSVRERADGSRLVIAESDDRHSADITAEKYGASMHMELAPVLPVRSFPEYHGLFHTAEDVMKTAAELDMDLSETAVEYEVRRSGDSRGEVIRKMDDIVEILLATLEKEKSAPREYADRILGRQAVKLDNISHEFMPPLLKSILKDITLMMEAKSSMEVIVAAPTCGSCGVLPGTFFGCMEQLGLSKEDVARAMFAAAMVGVMIVEHATIAAETGGCQAECGSASGMAAAGLVQLMGGSVRQALAAASMALQNTFGMVCDPVAGRVEVPCLGKNIQAGMNALACANMAMAGFDEVIPLDETIDAFYQTGLKIDPSLRCTCHGGLSVTPAARAVEERLKLDR